MSVTYGIALRVPTLPGGGLDTTGLRRLLRNQVDMGIDVLVPSGCERKLPEFDRLHVISIVVEELQDRAVVFARAQGAILSRIIRSARQLQSLGVAGVLCPPPLAGASQKHALEHFQALAAALTVQVIVDSAARPARTRLDLRTLNCLAEIPAVAGLNESLASAPHLIEIMQELPQRFPILCTSDGDAMALARTERVNATALMAPLPAA